MRNLNYELKQLCRRNRDGSHGLRVYKGALVVPVRDAAGHLHGLQFFGASGAKRLLKGGRVAGLYCLIGIPGSTVCIAEGYATGASIHVATGYAVAVANNAGNLGPVSAVIREKHPEEQLIVRADDDAGTPGNPGAHPHARCRPYGWCFARGPGAPGPPSYCAGDGSPLG